MMMRFPRLTLFGRSLLLMTCEVIANSVCWAVAGILFGRSPDTRPNLGLALLAWTLGLRHALDADHIRSIVLICAIDNATRSLINRNQLPVTCGLFFSLGHSTIVIVVTVAIAISTGVYERINGVGEIGGIIGAAVSGSFLFIIGLANSIILWKILKRRREDKARERRREKGEAVSDVEHRPEENHMIMMRILGPIINFVNRPWKMFPVGVLFGLGFDTASSIALLAVSALAKKGSGGTSIPSSHIVILPLLFTAGMTLIDSADSVLMLYSYAGFPERSLRLFARRENANDIQPDRQEKVQETKDLEKNGIEAQEVTELPKSGDGIDPSAPEMQTKMNMMSGLSIILTLMGILVAFSISLITIMGLIGEQCSPCTAAAEADDGHGGGLAGRWWRAWATAGDQSGYIGIAIVGVFSLIVVLWYGGRWAARKFRERKAGSRT